MVVNHHNKLEFSRLYNVCFVGRKQKYAYLHPKEDILNLYGDFIPYHDQLDKAFSKAMVITVFGQSEQRRQTF